MPAPAPYRHPSDGADVQELWTEFGQASWRAERRLKILRARAFIEERGEELAPAGWAALAREELPEIEVFRAPFARAFDLGFPSLHEPPRTPFEPDLIGGMFLYVSDGIAGRVTPILRHLTPNGLFTRRTRSHYLMLRLLHAEAAPPGPPQPWSDARLPAATQAREGSYIAFHDPRWAMASEEARICSAVDAASTLTAAREFAAAHRVPTCVGEVLHSVSGGGW